MKKTKIGQGYWQSGYGKSFKKSPIVWEINGKAYVVDSKKDAFQTDLDGYKMVNKAKLIGGNVYFFEVGLITEHLKLN